MRPARRLAGGGSVTFGAPMVLYSENPAGMYSQLQHLQTVAQGQGVTRKLQFHNIVNNADIVPRALGCSLNCIHQALETYLPSLSVSAGLHLCCTHTRRVCWSACSALSEPIHCKAVSTACYLELSGLRPALLRCNGTCPWSMLWLRNFLCYTDQQPCHKSSFSINLRLVPRHCKAASASGAGGPRDLTALSAIWAVPLCTWCVCPFTQAAIRDFRR